MEDLLDIPEFFGDDEPETALFEDLGSPYGAPETPVEPLAASSGSAAASPGPVKVATKAGVRLPQRPEMQTALVLAAQLGHVVTSGNDGKHLPNSLHYSDLAIDIRQAGDLHAQGAPYRAAGYHVLIEGPDFPGSTGAHLHVSKDPEGQRV